MQTDATSLVVTCCVRLHILLHVVVDCWEYMHCLHFLLGPGPRNIQEKLNKKVMQNFEGQTRYIKLRANRRNNSQQCCVRLHGAKSLTGFKLCATTHNNMQQGEKTDTTCYIQQCWELLANNVESVCT